MKSLRAVYLKKHKGHLKLGSIYQGNPEYSYFSLTPLELKPQKLKFVIAFNHIDLKFSICLSGQNKSVRKKYWEILKKRDAKNYRLVAEIASSLFIVDHILLENTDLDNRTQILNHVEVKSLKFMREMLSLLV